jgi:hypothetical protein
LEVSEQQLQEMIAAAVEAKTAELRAEVESTVENARDHERMAQLSMAAQEGAVMHMDPGVGYEFAVIPLDKVDFNPLSRRPEEELDSEHIGIRQLAKDIETRGGLSRPLLVYRKGERYMLVKGSRRLAALRRLGEELAHAYILPAKPPMSVEETWVNGY